MFPETWQVLQVSIEAGILVYIIKIQTRFAILETKVGLLMSAFVKEEKKCE